MQLTNKEHDQEVKSEQELFEKRIGLLNYLVDKSSKLLCSARFCSKLPMQNLMIHGMLLRRRQKTVPNQIAGKI